MPQRISLTTANSKRLFIHLSLSFDYIEFPSSILNILGLSYTNILLETTSHMLSKERRKLKDFFLLSPATHCLLPCANHILIQGHFSHVRRSFTLTVHLIRAEQIIFRFISSRPLVERLLPPSFHHSLAPLSFIVVILLTTLLNYPTACRHTHHRSRCT